uniref:Reverse transcriptase domain-containing protein n=1 Tax=Tanacetum cinerariifolium TaxID=118510 RepID=A0A6L2M148_TANCI|nr:reverse transcriptase domain-containing protein [Tanacetum cinerariifolium]
MEGHAPALKELLKEPNNRNLIKPMLLDFDDIQDSSDEETQKTQNDVKGKAKAGYEDLSKPFKEVLNCLFIRRIFEISSPGHRMPTNVRIYDDTGDPEDHMGRFVGVGNQGEWPMPVWCRMFQQTLDDKARAWAMVSESNAIPNVPELMQISSFMSSHKCPKLAKRFSDSIPKTVDEMLKRVDDYMRSEEAFHNTELPRGEFQRRDVPIKWMKVPITFPPVLARDLSEEALVIEAELEGYLVRRIYIDEGASIEIMFEHCFNMLNPFVRSRLVETQTTVSGFSGEQVKPLGKIELDGYPFHHPWDDEIPNFMGNGNVGIPNTSSVRMKERGEETGSETFRRERKSGDSRPNGASPCQSRPPRPRSYLMPMLRCVGPLQANYDIREIHMEACSMHLKARLVVAKAIRQGYYWPTMHWDAREEIRRCDSCQIHSPIPKLPKTLMTSIMAPWPFFQWGMDVLRPLPEALRKIRLTFGSEAVIPAEISMPTHRTMMIKEGDGNEEEMRLNLDLLTEKREAATIREAKYKMKMEQYYNKRVRPMSFKVG